MYELMYGFSHHPYFLENSSNPNYVMQQNDCPSTNQIFRARKIPFIGDQNLGFPFVNDPELQHCVRFDFQIDFRLRFFLGCWQHRTRMRQANDEFEQLELQRYLQFVQWINNRIPQSLSFRVTNAGDNQLLIYLCHRYLPDAPRLRLIYSPFVPQLNWHPPPGQYATMTMETDVNNNANAPLIDMFVGSHFPYRSRQLAFNGAFRLHIDTMWELMERNTMPNAQVTYTASALVHCTAQNVNLAVETLVEQAERRLVYVNLAIVQDINIPHFRAAMFARGYAVRDHNMLVARINGREIRVYVDRRNQYSTVRINSVIAR